MTNTMKTLLPQFGITSLDTVVRRITPTSDPSDFRQKVARTYRFIAVAGMGSRIVWGLALLILGGCMIAGGLLLYVTPLAMPVAILGLLLIPIGIWVAMSCDAKKIETQLRLFEAVCNDATNTSWRTPAQANANVAATAFQETIQTWLKGEFVAGRPVPEMREQLQVTVEAMTQLTTDIESNLATANQKLKEAREALQESQAAFRAIASKKSGRGRVRTLARRVVAAAEELVKQGRATIVWECTAQLLRSIAEQIVSTRGTVQNFEGSLRALSQEVSAKKRELTESNQTESFVGRALPSLADVFDQATEVVSANRQEVFGSFAAHTGGQIRETMQEAIEKIIADAEVMPKTFDAWWAAADDFRREKLLESIDTGANEFAVTKPIPGRVQQRVRHVLAHGGISCPAFEQVKVRSNSVLCRAINHADPTELFVVTESRYEPASEIVEFAACARTFSAMSPEIQSLAITVVDDDSEITDYKPESRSDPARPYRLLVLGLLSGEVVRTGAEQYRERDIINPKNGHFAKGFEDAAAAIRTDSELSNRLEKRINQCFEAEGQSAVLTRIRDSFKISEFVPAAVIPRFRQILLDEYQLRGGNTGDLSGTTLQKV